MLLIFFALVFAAILFIILVSWAGDGYELQHMLSTIVGVIGLIITGVGFVAYALAGWSWISSGYQAKVINQEFGTHYSKEDIFYASDVINEIKQLNRKRYEVNGNLITGEKKDQ